MPSGEGDYPRAAKAVGKAKFSGLWLEVRATCGLISLVVFFVALAEAGTSRIDRVFKKGERNMMNDLVLGNRTARPCFTGCVSVPPKRRLRTLAVEVAAFFFPGLTTFPSAL